MLAQSFLSHADLKITEAEHGALIKVLGMMERGELIEANYDYRDHETRNVPNGFSMGYSGDDCGTTACIGGWVAAIMGISQISYVNYQHSSSLKSLYWEVYEASLSQASNALRSFLTIGSPNWDEAMENV